ncbi:hypothetical protein GOX01_00250 [Gluconobacter oxydans]|nr:hypothetical protein GOX01_00250 [Gluconobacter oxydans]
MDGDGQAKGWRGLFSEQPWPRGLWVFSDCSFMPMPSSGRLPRRYCAGFLALSFLFRSPVRAWTTLGVLNGVVWAAYLLLRGILV